MTTDHPKFTLADVRRVCATLPKRRRNPGANSGDDDPTCVYTSPDGRHCIAGEIAVRMGVTVPGYAETGNGEQWKDGPMTVFFDETANDVLFHLQRLADYGDTWGAAIRDALPAAGGGEVGA